MPKPASVILGFLFLLGGTVGCFMLAGNHPKTLLWFTPGLGMFLLPVGCSIIGFGIRGPAIILRSLGAAIGRSEGTQTTEAERIISAFIGYVYGAGGFLFSVSFMTVGNFLPGIIAGGPEHIGKYVTAVTAPVVYSVVIAELVLRPLKHRLG